MKKLIVYAILAILMIAVAGCTCSREQETPALNKETINPGQKKAPPIIRRSISKMPMIPVEMREELKRRKAEVAAGQAPAPAAQQSPSQAQPAPAATPAPAPTKK